MIPKMSMPNPDHKTYRIPLLSERKENRLEGFYDYPSLFGAIADFIGWLEHEQNLTLAEAREIIKNAKK